MPRRPLGERPLTNAERQARHRDRRRGEKLKLWRPAPPLRGPRAAEWFTAPPPPQAGAYRVICADPPRQTVVWSAKGAGKSPDYETVPLPALKMLPIPAWASTGFCALFLWTTWAHLPQALELMDAWGFAYSTGAFTWGKLYAGRNPDCIRPDDWIKGYGPTVAVNTEPCLLGFRRGRSGRGVGGKTNRKDGTVRQMLAAPRGVHSEKPDEALRRIEALYDGPYLELFARHTRPGWDSWGDEVGRLDGLARAAE